MSFLRQSNCRLYNYRIAKYFENTTPNPDFLVNVIKFINKKINLKYIYIDEADVI